MNSLVKSYGKGLTGIFLALTAVWIAMLIVLPQARMIERAFTYVDRSGDAANLSLEIDRAYTRVFDIDIDLRDLNGQLAAGQASDAAPAAGLPAPSPSLTPSPSLPAAPSPSLPTPSLPSPGVPSPSLSAPSPSTPSPATPSPATPTPGVVPSPFASPQETLPREEIEARIAALEEEKAGLQARIAELEALLAARDAGA